MDAYGSTRRHIQRQVSSSSYSSVKSGPGGSSSGSYTQRPQRPAELWGEIERSIGLHGVRRIRPKKRSKLISAFWCLVLGFGFVLFLYEMSQCITLYMSYPTGWALGYTPPDRWPGITICNLNPVRITQLAKNYWDSPPNSRNPKTNGRRNFDWSEFLQERTYISSREFFLYNSHNSEDMIISCIAGNLTCSSQNFSMTPTEDGLCHKIVPDQEIDTLELWLNSEAYEYIEGLSHSTGFKVYIHDSEAVPIRDDTHVYIFPGYNFDLIIGRETYDSLAYPYGKCMSDTPDSRRCTAECYMAAVISACDCVPFWYSTLQMNGKAECNIYKHFSCVKRTIDTEHKLCKCRRSCLYTFFTAHVEMYPNTIKSLNKFFPLTHNLTMVSKQFEKSQYVHSRTSKRLKDQDSQIINTFLSAYRNGKFKLEESERGLYDVNVNAEEEVKDLKPRIRLHTDIALGGVMKIMKLGYSDMWGRIERTHLNRIAYDSRSIMSKYDRALKQLKYATVTEMTMARVLYTIGDMDLSVKIDLAAEAVDNVTKLYYAYINAEPNLSVEITPYKRYDDALIPNTILMNGKDSHQKYHHSLTNKLGNYIESILVLKNIIRNTLSTRDYNESAKNITRDLFLSHSVAIENAKNEFRENVVNKCQSQISARITNMYKLNASYLELIAKIRAHIANMEIYYTALHRNLFQDLEHLIFTCDSYLKHSNVSKAGLVFLFSGHYVTDKVYRIDRASVELALEYRKLSSLSDQLRDTILLIWNEFFHEPLLSNFYVKLNNDVMQMMSNELKTQYLLNIFTDKRMLDMPMDNKTTSGVLLEQVLVLLNANINMKDYANKSLQINQTFAKINDKAEEGYSFINFLKELGINLKKSAEYLKGYENRLKISDNFSSTNLLKVKLILNPAEYREWTEHSAYSLTVFIAQIGGLAAFMLGASFLTILEICDIFLAWCSDKFCAEGSPATKQYPAEYRRRYKSRESLNSTSTTRDLIINSSLNSNKRAYVACQAFNHISGSEM